MAGRYELVTAGSMARDPDLAALLAASSGGNLAIMGNELDALDRLAIMGQDAGASGVTPAMIQAAIANKLAQGSLLTRTDTPTRAREYPIGFVSAIPVPAGGTATVISRPQIVFRGERLLIPSDIAGQFVVNQLIVGKNPQQVSSDPIPGRVFDERGVGVRMSMDTAQISQDIAILVTNIGGAPATFRAAIIGAAVE